MAPSMLMTPGFQLRKPPLPAGITGSVSATQISLFDAAGNDHVLQSSPGAWAVTAPVGEPPSPSAGDRRLRFYGKFLRGRLRGTDPGHHDLLAVDLRFPVQHDGQTPATFPGGTFYPAKSGQVHLTVNPVGATIKVH